MATPSVPVGRHESPQDCKDLTESAQDCIEVNETTEEPVVLRRKTKGRFSSDFECILAIDLGTMYSGYAYALKDSIDLETEKIDDIWCRQTWNSGRANLMSHKTSTCILLNKDKELDSFGFDAENKYIRIVENKRQDEYYFFRRFKMVLYEKKITPTLSLTDETGKQLPAKLVFEKSIYALTHDFLEYMKQRGWSIDSGKIRYVLTVPAIWSDAAKQFMREAAIAAGIGNTELLLALEPEAASVYNQFVKLAGIDEQRLTLSKVGTRYLVADIGAGTVDIAVHESLENKFVRETHRCRGDDCGGDSINMAFQRELNRIFGAPVLQELRNEDPSMLVELFREFEAAKKTVDGKSDVEFKVRLPFLINKFLRDKTDEDLDEILKNSPHGSEISYKRDNLCIKQSLVIDIFFKPTTDKIIQLMKEVVLKVEGKIPTPETTINKILLVGGFSDSQYIQNAVRKNFPTKLVIIPEAADLCVLKGAVLFGHAPHLISHRVVRFSYGIVTVDDFDSKIHEVKRKLVVDGNEYCDNVFEKYVNIGYVVEIGTTITRCLSTIQHFQKRVSLPIVTSLSSNPKYADEEDCVEIGELTVDIENPTKGKRDFYVSLVFGNTEIQVLAKDALTGKSQKTNLDFILY